MNDAVPAPYDIHFLGSYRWPWRCRTCPKHFPVLLANIAEDFTPQSDGLVPTYQVPLRYLL